MEEKVPSGHGEHAFRRTLGVNVPIAHGLGALEPASQNEPAGQFAHVVSDIAASAAEYVPGEQAMHLKKPVAFVTLFHVPDGHGTGALLPSVQ